jgi:hypothetical protein
MLKLTFQWYINEQLKGGKEKNPIYAEIQVFKRYNVQGLP